MSVYKKGTNKNGVWYVCVQVAGKRVQCCTHTTDKAVAQGIESAIIQGMRGLPADRVCDIVRAYLDPTDEKSKSTPRKRVIGLLPRTVEALLAEESLADTTKEDRVKVVSRLVNWLTSEYPKMRSIDGITSEIAWQFVASIKGKTKTKQNIVGELTATWNMLIRSGIIKEHNPWKIARPRSVASEKRHGTAFTPEEITRILDESRRFIQTAPSGFVDEEARLAEPRDTWLTTAILIAVYTGFRQKDVFSLKWEDINFGRGLIDIIPSKTARHRIRVTIPMHPALAKHLQGLEKRADGLILKAPLKPQYAWNLCVKRAGVTRDEDEMTTFHSLRHTYATWLRDAGAEKGEQMLLGGWTNVNTSNRYDHSLGKLTELIERLPTN